MKNIFLGVIITLVLWIFLYVDFLDRCKFCGKVRAGKGNGFICKYCGEKFATKYPHLKVLTYIIIPVVVVLIFIYKHAFI